MNNYGVILKKLRLVNRLTIKEAAKKIQKSTGWICEAENARGAARIFPDEFERIVLAYGGDAYRKQFGGWIAKASPQGSDHLSNTSFGGSVLKYLRKKAKMSLQDVTKQTGFSIAYLSYIESGKKALPPQLRDQLMKVYGYSPTSFKNFASEDKRAKNVPVKYKLETLLGKLDDSKIERVFQFALEIFQDSNSQSLQLKSPSKNGSCSGLNKY